MIRKIIKNKQAFIGLVMILFIVTIAVFAPTIATNDPMKVDVVNKFHNISSEYPLGTDQLGRCVYSRLVYGARYSLGIAIPILLIISILSIILGTSIAYIGGIVDRIFIGICDILMAFPPLVVLLALVGALGQGTLNLVLAMILSMWAWYAKIVRSYVLVEKNKDYIASARIAGSTDIKIIFKHIIPNVLPSLIVFFSIGIGSMILMISGFSFLGMGVEAGRPEWGAMLSGAKQYIYSRPYMIFYPGFCILFTVAGFNLFGEALRDIMSSKQEVYKNE